MTPRKSKAASWSRVVGALVAVALSGVGCDTTTKLANGTFPCAADGQCPAAYHCAIDRQCWRDGSDPPAPRPGLFWTSNGGGSTVGGAGGRLNLSVGGLPVAGRAATTGKSIEAGNLSSAY